MIIYVRKQASIAVCVLLIAAVAGLFSSCERQHMDNRSANRITDESSKTPDQTPVVGLSATPEEEGPPQPPQESNPASGPTPIETPEPAEMPSLPPAPATSPTPSETPNPTPAPTPKPTQTPAPSPKPIALSVVNPYVRYTWDQMMAETAKLQEKYPEWVSLASAGLSVEGRDLLLVKLGTGNKKIFLCGAHHAREYISSSYLMKMIETYADYAAKDEKYGDYDVKALLEKVTIYIVPMVNPGGVNLVNNGLKAVNNQEAVEAMAMQRNSYREWKANIDGVDLNRQYPAYWEEKYDDVGVPASENYKGAASATEPEVQAMISLTEANDFILSASFHTKGNLIYWADRGTVDLIPGVKDIAKRLGSLTGYDLMPVSEKPSVYGAGYENWFRLEFKRPSFCIELTPSDNTDMPHNDKDFDSLVWKNAKYIGLLLADEAIKR